MSDKQKEEFGLDLADEYSRYKKNNPSASPLDYMKVLFKFMEANNMKGVAIYKANDDLSEWSKQSYNKETKQIISIPCP